MLYWYFQECVRRFPVPLCGNDGPQKQDKFVLTAPPEQLKCVVTLTGDSITHAVCLYLCHIAVTLMSCILPGFPVLPLHNLYLGSPFLIGAVCEKCMETFTNGSFSKYHT